MTKHECRIKEYENRVVRVSMSASGTMCGDIVPYVEVYRCNGCGSMYYAVNHGMEPSNDYPEIRPCHPSIDEKVVEEMEKMSFDQASRVVWQGKL